MMKVSHSRFKRKTIYDLIFQATGELISVSLELIGTIIASSLFQFFRSLLSTSLSEKFSWSLRRKLYSHLQKLSIEHYTSPECSGEFLVLFNSELNGTQMSISSLIPSLCSRVLSLIFSLFWLFKIDIILGVFGLILITLFYFPTKYVGNKLNELKNNSLRSRKELNSLVFSIFNLEGMILVKEFERVGELVNNKFKSINQSIWKNDLSKSFISSLLSNSLIFLSSAVVGLLYALYLTLNQYSYLFPVPLSLFSSFSSSSSSSLPTQLGGVDPSSLIVFLSYIERLLSPLQSLSDLQLKIQSSFFSLSRLCFYLSLPTHSEIQLKYIQQYLSNSNSNPKLNQNETEIEKNKFKDIKNDDHYNENKEEIHKCCMLVDPSQIHGQLEMSNFSYSFGSSVILKNLNLNIMPGQFVVISGKNGAGKTTLSHVLSGLLPIQSNHSITLDHKYPLGIIDQKCLKQIVSLLPQNSYCLNETIADNLYLSNPSASQEQIESICKGVNLHEKIKSLPNGYQTELGSGRYSLSGGEKQQLSIARIILKNPKILILDEFNSSLDEENEEQIFQYLVEKFKGKSTLIFLFCHRFPKRWGKYFDLSLTLKNGELILN